MRGQEPPVSEEDLHGFVDGGLNRGRREAVEAYLAASPADAARVGIWRRQNERIVAAFAAMETPAPPQLPPWASPFLSGVGGVSAMGLGAMASGDGEGRAPMRSWRERWFAGLTGLAFASGLLFAAGAGYFASRDAGTDGELPFASGAFAVKGNETFAARTLSALHSFDPPPGAARLSSKASLIPKASLFPREREEQDLAVPILPNLPAGDLKLAGIRAMPGESGQMLCMFYARPDAGNLALCAEKTPGPIETIARLSGSYPLATIFWRQNGANYALTGALQEPELRALADAVRAQIEAFGAR